MKYNLSDISISYLTQQQTKMNAQQNKQVAMRSDKTLFSTLEYELSSSSSSISTKNTKMNLNKQTSVVRNTKIAPLNADFKLRSSSLENKNENARRAFIEIETVETVLQEAIARMSKFSVSRRSWKNAKKINVPIVFPSDMPLTENQRTWAKQERRFIPKIVNVGHRKTKLQSQIPPNAPPTRMSGNGMKVVDKKKNNTQGDGIVHKSIPLPPSNVNTTYGEDLYLKWKQSGVASDFPSWAVSEGYWFENSKEKRRYQKKYPGQKIDPVLLKIMRGVENGEKYDLTEEQIMESMWDDNANPAQELPPVCVEKEEVSKQEFVTQGNTNDDEEEFEYVFPSKKSLMQNNINDCEIKGIWCLKDKSFGKCCTHPNCHRFLKDQLTEYLEELFPRCEYKSVREHCDYVFCTCCFCIRQIARDLLKYNGMTITRSGFNAQGKTMAEKIEETHKNLANNMAQSHPQHVIQAHSYPSCSYNSECRCSKHMNEKREIVAEEISTRFPFSYEVVFEIARLYDCFCPECKLRIVTKTLDATNDIRKKRNEPELVFSQKQFTAQMFSASTAMCKSITDKLPTVEKTLNTITNTCEKITSLVDGFSAGVIEGAKRISDWLSFFMQGLDLVGLSLKIVRYIKDCVDGNWFNVVINIVIDVISAISEAIKFADMEDKVRGLEIANATYKNKLEGILNLVAQAPADNELAVQVKGLAMFEAQGLTDILSHSLFSKLQLGSAGFSRLRNFNTIISFIKNGKFVFEEIAQYLPGCIKELLGLAHDDLILTDDEFEAFAKKTNAVFVIYSSEPIKLTEQPKQYYVDLYQQALDYLKRATMSYKKGSMANSLRFITKQLSQIVEIYDDKEQLGFQRMNPFAILLHGKPGTGKSEVAKKIAAHFHDWTSDTRLAAQDTLQRMAQNKGTYCYQSHLEYMDGYQKQGVIIADELGARNDGEDLDNFFPMVSSNIFVCPMATLDNPVVGRKGTTFTSHSIIACSNKSDFNHLQNTYHTTAAINRRFIFRIEVLEDPQITRRDDFSHLTFKLSNFDTNKSYTLAELLYILKEHKKGFISFFTERANINYQVIQMQPVDLNFRAQTLIGELSDCVEGSIYGVLLVQAVMKLVVEGNYSYNWALRETRNQTQSKWAILLQMSVRVIGSLASLGVIGFLFYKAISRSGKIFELEQENVVNEYYIGYLQIERENLIKQLRELDKTNAGKLAKKEIEFIMQSRTPKEYVGNRREEHSRYFAQSLENEFVRTRILRVLDGLMDEKDCTPECKKQLAELREITINLPVELVMSDIPFKPIKYGVGSKAVATFNTQGAQDMAALQIEQKLVHYMCFMQLNQNGKVSQSMCALPLRHVSVVVPKHFLRHVIDPNATITIDWYGGDYTQEISLKDIKQIPLQQDVLILNIPTLKWRFPNLVKNFISEKELCMLHEQPGTLVSVARAKQGAVRLYSTKVSTLREVVEYICQADAEPEKDPITLVNGFVYDVNSEQGDCGSPLVIHETNIKGKIIGMHVAGSLTEALGLSVLLTREAMEMFLSDNYIDFKETKCVTMGSIVAMGRPPCPIHVNRKTAFYRTHLPFDNPPKIPADLSRDKTYDKILEAMLKNANEDDGSRIPLHLLNHAVTYISTKFPKNRNTTILDWEVAISGYGALDGINLTTSPGYPYVLDAKKSDYITKDKMGVYHIVDRQIIVDCEKLEQQAKSEPPAIFWVSCGKDELKKPGKICRVFEIAPMHFTLLGRRYFGAFIEYIQANPGKLYSMIGINPESFEWQQMYSSLVAKSSRGYAWDWNKYDSTIKAYLMDSFADLVNSWYEDEHSNIRRNICRALMARPTVFGDVLLMITGGNPSGHFATSISNSYIQVIIIMSYWLATAPIEQRDLIFFDELIGLKVYGDDSLVAVSPKARWFTFDGFAEYVNKIGMEIQLDTKEAGITTVRNISELTFLKRSFEFDYRGTITPKLDWNSMISMLLWNRQSKYMTKEEMYRVNSRVFSQFLYFYGEEKYKEITQKYDLVIPSWDYYDRLFYSGGEFPYSY